MNETKLRYGVIGLGAIGGYYGARLQHGGADVHFLLRRGAEALRQQGVTLESVHGNVHLPQVQVYDHMADMPRCDVLLVATKSTSNDQLPALLPPLLAPDGVVVMMQNGLWPEKQAAEVVGEGRVVGGICFICTVLQGPGRIVHTAEGKLTLCPLQSTPTTATTARLQTMLADLARGQVEAVQGADLAFARWAKLVWNIPFNALSVLLNASTHAQLQNPRSLSATRTLMQEVLHAAQVLGVQLPESLCEVMVQTTLGLPDYHSSMWHDFRNRRPMEVEAILGDPWRAATAAGAHLPQMALVYDLVGALSG